MVYQRFMFFLVHLFPLWIQAKEPIHDVKTKKMALSYTSRINPQDLLAVIEGLLAAMRSGDIDKAYQEFTSTEFRERTSLEEFKVLTNQYPSFSSNKLFQFQSFYTENDIATFGGDLLSATGVSIPVEYDLVLENGKWKIYGIQVYQNELSRPLKDNF